MPLRDHFRPPLDDLTWWEGLHGGWPMVIVQHLVRHLPPGFVAIPKVHRGSVVEVDVAAFGPPSAGAPAPAGGGGVATAWAPARPTLTTEVDFADADEYAVEVYDRRRGRRLVAAVEIVSPSNKDRPATRRAFVSKCAAFLQTGVSVAVVDLVTTRHFNLYRDLLDVIGRPAPAGEVSAVYAAACRLLPAAEPGGRDRLEAWDYPLAVGQPLPELPLWLSAGVSVPLELDASYEVTCRDLQIP
ncbi:MAG: DUF4058 family protein [Gemmataceae bacterium]|nr:DUF4058 family protein [Gemmataceae bacterium]